MPNGPLTPYILMTVFCSIRQQNEGQLVLAPNLAWDSGALRADADDPQPGPLDLRVQVAQHAGLAGASGGEIRGVEVQDDGAGAQEFGQRSILPVSSGRVNSGARSPALIMYFRLLSPILA